MFLPHTHCIVGPSRALTQEARIPSLSLRQNLGICCWKFLMRIPDGTDFLQSWLLKVKQLLALKRAMFTVAGARVTFLRDETNLLDWFLRAKLYVIHLVSISAFCQHFHIHLYLLVTLSVSLNLSLWERLRRWYGRAMLIWQPRDFDRANGATDQDKSNPLLNGTRTEEERDLNKPDNFQQRGWPQ